MKKRRGSVWVMLLIVGLIIFLALAAYAISTLLDYRKGQEEYDGLRQTIEQPASTAGATFVPKTYYVDPAQGSSTYAVIDGDSSAAQATTQPGITPEKHLSQTIDFAALREINTDVVGWVTLDGTNIDYPIVQGTDDTYYLTHTFRGTQSKSGCVFLGHIYDSAFGEENSVLYGHHMKDGTMFRDLVLYKDKAFFDEHLTGRLYTPDGDYLLNVFSAYIIYDDATFQRSGFGDETTTNAFYDELVRRSAVKAPFTPRWPQQILTLVTCTYEYDDARYIVHALMTPVAEAGSILQ